MKVFKRLMVLTLTVSMMLSVTGFAKTLVRIGEYDLRPGDSASTSNMTLDNSTNGFYITQYILPTASTKENIEVARYTGWWNARSVIVKLDVAVSSKGWKYTRINKAIDEGTTINFKFKNAGSRSFDILKGDINDL